MDLVVSCSLLKNRGKGIAFLDPEFMRAGHITAGDTIKIQSRTGRSILTRAAALPTEKAGQKRVCLDHYLCRVIKVSPGESVRVEKVSTKPVNRVFLMPISTTTLPLDKLKVHLIKFLSVDSVPVSPGSIFTLSIPDAQEFVIVKVSEVDPEPGTVNAETMVEVVSPSSPEASMTEHDHGHKHMQGPISEVTYEDVGGLDKEVRMVRELVEVPLLFPQVYAHLGINLPRGIIFHGPAGVGKTHLALALANEIDAKLFYINGPEIVSTDFGETESNLRRVFQKAIDHRPSIILIDELDAIAPKRGETGSFTTSRTVSYLLSLLDGLKKSDGLIVIGTTNNLDSIDNAARRPGRFDREIFLSPPDIAARVEILRIHTRGMPLSEDAIDYLDEVGLKTIGFVGADLMELCREAGLNAFRKKFGDHTDHSAALLVSLDGLMVEKSDFDYALGKIRPSALRQVMETISDTCWNDIGGLEKVKKQLRELVQLPLLYSDTLVSMKIHPPVGVLLYGNPGTGKTLLVKALARECHANFISVKGSEIFSKWLGESEAEVRSIFQLAYRVTPAIIFFDHIDALAPKRGREEGSQAAERVVNQLQIEMDSILPGSKLLVVAATNRIDLVDPALLQSNRFGTHIFVPMPDEADRKAILCIYLKDVPLVGKTNLDEITDMMAAHTEGFSGAELEALCHRAKILAVRSSNFKRSIPLKLDDFKEALIQVKESRYTLK